MILVPGLGNVMFVAIVTESHVQHELPVHAPVVLREEPEVVINLLERVHAGAESNRGHFVPQDIVKSLESRKGPSLRTGPPSSLKSQDAAKFPGVRSTDNGELLFKLPTREDAPRLILRPENCQTRKRNWLDLAPARNRFWPVGIALIPELLNSVQQVPVVSSPGRRSPPAPPFHVNRTRTLRTARGHLRIQGILRRSQLVWMSAGER